MSYAINISIIKYTKNTHKNAQKKPRIREDTDRISCSVGLLTPRKPPKSATPRIYRNNTPPGGLFRWSFILVFDH